MSVENGETREGWPLLTVETEVNGDSKRTIDRDSFLGWLVGLVMPVREIFCHALAALVSTVHFFILLVPVAQPPRHAVVLGRLSLCLW
jgi:hypothetical protein